MRFALVGNPNSGKTTLFNHLTGSSAHVGNWPGVTVERKEGVYKALGEPISIIDLPGIYSLSPYTPEEVVARNYILDENPDLIINIVDATNLERNLYLTTQLIETQCPVVVALNMMDVVEKNGDKIDLEVLEKELGTPVVPISALRADGIKILMTRAKDAIGKRDCESVLCGTYLGDGVNEITALLQKDKADHPVFRAVKLLEGDPLEKDYSPEFMAEVDRIKKSVKLSDDVDGDFEAAVADLRYRHITDHFRQAVTKARKPHELTTSDKIDRLLTNKFLGIPIFLFVMFLVFHVTFSEDFLYLTSFGVAEEPMLSPGVWMLEKTGEFMEVVKEAAAHGLEALGASEWVFGMIVDGLLEGLGAVLSFLPQILMLFLFLSIMEDSGYMARAAFLMDRILRRFGLSGKSFLPMLMGFGCSVPAMMATRTLESIKDRRITIMLMPCFSCGAKAPIWAMFAAALFPRNADLLIFAIYMIGILTAVIAGIILKTFIFKGEAVPFIMELPAYHFPTIRNVIRNLWEKLKSFLVRASTIIAGATIVIWFLSNFDFSLNMVEANSAETILGVLGTALIPVFAPLGFASGPDGWKAVVAILTGLIAKEMVVSTMGVLYNPGIEGDALEDEVAGTALATTLAATFSPVAALSFMAFNLLSIPCMAAVATAHSELKSTKWTFGAVLFWLVTAWLVAFAIFQIGTAMGWGTEVIGAVSAAS